jgi:hypothetical protein
LEGGPPGFPRDSPRPAVLGHAANPPLGLRLRGCHPLRPPFPWRSARSIGQVECRQALPRRPTTPRPQRLPPCTAVVWAGARFAHRYSGPRCCLLLLGVLRCFSSPGSPRQPMDSAGDDPASPGSGCPIRTPVDHGPSTAPHGFSQSPASFIGPRRQGIPRAPHAARRPPAGAPSPRDPLDPAPLSSTTLRLSKSDRPGDEKSPRLRSGNCFTPGGLTTSAQASQLRRRHLTNVRPIARPCAHTASVV